MHRDIHKTLHYHVDLNKRLKEFNVGDYVMVRIRLKRLLAMTVCKLQAHSVGPFKVIKCIGINAYLLGPSTQLCLQTQLLTLKTSPHIMHPFQFLNLWLMIPHSHLSIPHSHIPCLDSRQHLTQAIRVPLTASTGTN